MNKWQPEDPVKDLIIEHGRSIRCWPALSLILTLIIQLVKYSMRRLIQTLILGEGTMTQDEIILAAMAASEGEVHTPVQIQKLLFLLDRKIPDRIGGPLFNFVAYDYGPFDKEIYTLLDRLSRSGLVDVISERGIPWRKYRLTPAGQRQGECTLKGLEEEIAAYIRRLSEFVRSLSFTDLLSTIYKAFPDMSINSVFKS